MGEAHRILHTLVNTNRKGLKGYNIPAMGEAHRILHTLVNTNRKGLKGYNMPAMGEAHRLYHYNKIVHPVKKV